MNSWPIRKPRYAIVEWLPLSMRSFIVSNGATSATSSAPAASHAGRGATKRSSITQLLYGSATTGAASVTPRRRAASAMSSSVVAGTMRSTIVHGNAACCAIHSASAGSRFCANASTRPSSVRPLCGRLSQHTTLSAPAPVALRTARPATTKPTAEHGASGCARSWTTSGCARLSAPVAGSWQ